jgi:hypothetical protein
VYERQARQKRRCYADRKIEIFQAPWRALRIDKCTDVRVIDAQHAHISAAAATALPDDRSRMIERRDP